MKKSGFTLIEVLIALIILAIALTAVVKAVNEDVKNAIIIRDKTIATWVGDDVLAKMQAGLSATPNGKISNGSMQMLGNNWFWTAGIDKGSSKQILRIYIDVNKQKGGKRAARVIGFVRVVGKVAA